tara:strand:+ start:263 stop:460 length:198 start_codon:yes stop_codon:yes gene_type:complete
MTNNAVNLENLSTKIAAVSRDEIRIAVLQDEIEICKSRLESQTHQTIHLRTVISVIQNRIDEIKK